MEGIMNHIKKTVVWFFIVSMVLAMGTGCTGVPEKKSSDKYESEKKREGSDGY
jgi:hypothetical protein